MTTLFTHIKGLVNVRTESKILRGNQLKDLPVAEDAFLLVEDRLIIAFGSMQDMDILLPNLPPVVINCEGQFVLPAWCDSHTHLVFAGSRESEFVDKINGLSYADIAAKGGGILNSAAVLNQTSFNELYSRSEHRLNEIAALGTGAVEIKSGYGLTVEGELTMLRVIKKLKQNSNLLIKSTFLGAHAYPMQFKDDHEGYIQMIINEMLPTISREGLADFIDVFCETGFFSAEETRRICAAGKNYGLVPKLHVNQLSGIGGIETGIAAGALSLDHLETLSDEEVRLLAQFEGCSTLLPTAAFFLRMQYQPARRLIDAGAAVTLASDFNPGSSPSGNMNFVNALSCIQMKMLPEEVINASTGNGAFAMGVEDKVGSVGVGKIANLIFTKKIPSLAYLFYSFGSNNIDRVMINGNWINN